MTFIRMDELGFPLMNINLIVDVFLIRIHLLNKSIFFRNSNNINDDLHHRLSLLYKVGDEVEEVVCSYSNVCGY